jgi:hypothetical protein
MTRVQRKTHMLSWLKSTSSKLTIVHSYMWKDWSRLSFASNAWTYLSTAAVIFTSSNAVDHYFRLAKDMRLPIPETHEIFLHVRGHSLLFAEIHSIQQTENILWTQHISGADGAHPKTQNGKISSTLF